MEPEVLHRSDASQNDHKSKGYLPVKTDKNVLKRLGYPTFIRLSKIRLNSPSVECGGPREENVEKRPAADWCNPKSPKSLEIQNQFTLRALQERAGAFSGKTSS